MKRRILTIAAYAGVFIIGLVIGISANGTQTKTVAGPTVTATAPGPTVTATETATATVTPTANSQGIATQINASGVYVVGKDMVSGTWHTTGSPSGDSCYYATLRTTNTSDIIDNNNFSGPETVTVTGAHALEIDGDCTWAKQ